MLFRRTNQGGVQWIVVFLGNPGMKYAGTRHNTGFLTAEKLEKRKGIRIDRLKYKALTAVCPLGEKGENALLMKPQTYMNLSGDAVRPAMDFYKVPLDHVIVVSDDISMELGKLRIRKSGSAGGHNGLKDIIAKCGGEGFPRIKIGVGVPPPQWDTADWVLSVFRNQDAEIMSDACERASQAIECYIDEGPDKAMNRFNQK
jgi:PTH1 family peptidyl-tRNA hydrolase